MTLNLHFHDPTDLVPGISYSSSLPRMYRRAASLRGRQVDPLASALFKALDFARPPQEGSAGLAAHYKAATSSQPSSSLVLRRPPTSVRMEINIADR